MLFGREEPIDLAPHLQDMPKKGLCRAKVIYDEKSISTYYYIYKAKKIAKIKCIEATFNYPHKYLDREKIDTLLVLHPNYDELILTHNGLLTDATIANIALRQEGIWYTPTTPLLPGTTRARLLDEGKIIPRAISVSEIAHYDGLALMNAMIGFYEIDMGLLPRSDI